MDRVTQMASERPVVIFSRSSCCMCHTIKTLFSDFGVHPNVHELDEIPRGNDIEQALSRLGCSPSVPVVFIGGELVGGANEVMSLHLNRSLIPMLRRAGALWMERITKLASQKAVVIFSKSSCGMSHAIKRLFYEQGVGPAIYELDEDTRGKEMEWALMRLGCNPSVPAVFVGGKFVGSANTVMTLHLNGSLKKMLRDAGALWL
ncbi:Monothiol glutaredoxin-S10 [Glycine max]|nr:Monothiol glutaredoxin-S10 [Glycine max]